MTPLLTGQCATVTLLLCQRYYTMLPRGWCPWACLKSLLTWLWHMLTQIGWVLLRGEGWVGTRQYPCNFICVYSDSTSSIRSAAFKMQRAIFVNRFSTETWRRFSYCHFLHSNEASLNFSWCIFEINVTIHSHVHFFLLLYFQCFRFPFVVPVWGVLDSFSLTRLCSVFRHQQRCLKPYSR